MKYDDLCFEMINEDGIEVKCDILSVIPDGENTYIVFTDYRLDDNNNFILQYGKITQNKDTEGFVIIHDKKIIKRIKNLQNEFSIGYVNKQIQKNIN